MSTTATAPAALPAAQTDAQRLSALLEQVEHGQAVNHADVVALAQSPDRNTRGLAKRLLAHLLISRAQHDAADMLEQACEELEYRYPVVLQEATERAQAVGRTSQVFAMWTRAAEHALGRQEYLPALLSLMNGYGLDFRAGAKHFDTEECTRHTVALYERVAAAAAKPLSIPPIPRRQRRSPPGGKLRLAHVVPQLVDQGHAPTLVMKSLLKYADRERFDTYLFVTEAFATHDQRPYQMFGCDWSVRRAPQTIQHIARELGIPVFLPRTRQNILLSAADLHTQMAELGIDVAYHHGSIASPSDWLLCAWQCAPWQVAYGMGVPLHCPHVDYQFFEYAESMETLAFLCREHGIPYGTSDYGGTDLSYLDQIEPIPRAQMNVPNDHVVLGTLGNHLATRMTTPFCRVVADVMRAHPKTTYFVIGMGDLSAQRAAFGEDLCGGPQPRVRFPGNTNETGRWTKSLDIYLNQYPAGGGIAVCEAMAARVPVLGMCVDDSNLAAAGLKLLGAENVVQPATDTAYAARLAQLIEDAGERKRLGEALWQRYESDFNGRRFAQDVTDRIYALVQQSLAAASCPAVSPAAKPTGEVEPTP